MIKIFREYLKYQINAQQRHGVHSPYVYNFGDKCIRLKVPKKVTSDFKAYKKSLLKDKTIIDVQDLGAGSKKLNQQRAIKKIAKVSGSTNKYGKLLYRLVAHYHAKEILELGTSLGLGTYWLSVPNKQVKVTTVEGCKNTFNYTTSHFPQALHAQINFVNASFIDFLSDLSNHPPFDLVFIDGDHQKESLFEQLRLLTPYIHDETIIVLDDIRWSKGMQEAWQSLILDENYHLTMDLFKMGMIVKRHHQEKQHFIIRY